MVMEETKKRVRDESDAGLVSSPEPDNLGPFTSAFQEADLTESKRPRVDGPEDYSSSPESWRIEETILDILDDPIDVDTAVQGLDSVIRSFEEEILGAPAHQPDLGYLLEASDDELGLPPTLANYSSSDVRGFGGAGWSESSDGFELGGLFGFDNEFAGYGGYEFAVGADGCWSGYGGGDGEFVAVGGLFDYVEPDSEWAEI
ncbi:uncharacterized protein LOC116213624 [Punica granatum]|uniref:Uncharacterized protein LOC116213624 n=2 Tax=Punica granatum TaxID=22663 RepID=A0A6P8EGG5_PUNGR|nr:uncharacterized protein LOC116213624 [Punica granatum]PKI43866.1 hypothetical protein CRG98_035700 [Punica granatum]